ncbi:MAG: ABC transporter substrate-binding protein, partial [Gammaproteobacteria bacterium]
GEAIPVDYTLRWKDGAWRVVDVKIDGVSLVANYRSTFGTEIRSRGIQALLARLEQRVQENTQRDRDRSGGGGGDTDAGG